MVIEYPLIASKRTTVDFCAGRNLSQISGTFFWLPDLKYPQVVPSGSLKLL